MSPLLSIDTIDEQGTWAPTWLVTIDLGGGVVRRYATSGDLPDLALPYDGQLVDGSAPQVERRLVDTMWGAVEVQDVTVELSNAAGELTADMLAGIAGKSMTISWYDRVSRTLIPAWTGVVSRRIMGRARVTVEGSTLDRSILEEPMPRGVIETDTWPLAVDVGAVIPVVFGAVHRLPMLNVKDDKIGSLFDYIVAHGTVALSGAERWRNDTYYSIDFSEFVRAAGGAATSWSEVARTDLYAGYTAVRFALRQVDSSNAFFRMYANVRGLWPERNFARAVKTMMSNSAWGLGRTVNGASFDAAEAALPTSYESEISKLAPTLYMRLGEVSADTIAVDKSGYGHHGAYGGTVTKEQTGALDNDPDTAIQFVGAGNGITVPSSPLLGSATAISVEAWVMVLSLGSTDWQIVQKTIAGADDSQWRLFQNGGLIRFKIRHGGGTGAQANYTLVAGDLNTWHHYVAIAVSSDKVYLYRDGSLVGTSGAIGTMDTGAGDLLVGIDGSGGAGNGGNHKLDEVVVYNYDITSFVSARYAARTLEPTSLLCDGALRTERQAQAWLREALMVRGMRLGLNASGEWTLVVDTPATSAYLIAQDGPGVGERTLLDASDRAEPPLEDRIKTLRVDYREDFTAQRFLFPQTRAVNASGRDRIMENRFIRDHRTADVVADYLGKRLLYGQETVRLELTQEARGLQEGHIIRLIDPSIGYAAPGADVEVRSVQKALARILAVVNGWAAAIYTYVAGALPADNVTGTELDTSNTSPSPATSLAIASSGTRVAGDGHVTSFVRLGFTNPTSNFSHALVKYRKNGTTDWVVAGDQVRATGATNATIEGLLPNTSYDYTVQVVNRQSLVSVGDPTLTNQTSPTDSSVPSAPSGITVIQAGGKVVEVRVTTTPPSDWGTTRLYRNTTNNSGTATEIASGKKLVFHDENVTYGTTYFYWAKIEDQSANLSGFSPSSSHSVTVVRIVTNDITDSNVTNGKLGSGAVTNPKVTQREITDANWVNNTGNAFYDGNPSSFVLDTELTGIVIASGDELVVQYGCNLEIQNNDASAQGIGVTIELRRGSTVIQSRSMTFLLAAGEGVVINSTGSAIETAVSPSTYTYAAYIAVSGTVDGEDADVRSFNRSLQVLRCRA